MTPDAAASLAEAIPLPCLVVRRDERIAAANTAARSLLGTATAGRHFITVLRQPALLDAVEACLRDGAPRVTQYLTHDGRQDTTFRVAVRPLRVDDETGVLVCFEDTTHLEQAEQMRRDFVANVSHELRTPLTALMGFIETLQGPARADPAARDRFLGIMATECTRMVRLVQDLLSLSRVEAQERVRPTERVDPAAILQATARGLMPLAENAGVALRFELSQTPVLVPGDSDQLRQVFTNLIENAIKYGGAGSTVTLGVSGPREEPGLRQPGLRITVRDTGPGIDPVHLPRLTERFYRVDTHRSREKGGTGLGLAIVKHIVNRHRGRLRIRSAPGEGTEVVVILPLESA